MASMGGAYLDPEPTARLVKTYVNKFLQQICVGEGMSKFGVKAELQNRIIDRLREYAAKGDVRAFESFQQTIQNAPHAEAHLYSGMAGSLSSINTPATPSGYLNNGGGSNIGGGSGYRIHGHPRIEFKSTPFYVIEEQLGDPAPCETMQHHRHTVKIPLRVSDHPILARVLREPTLRVMVFCAGEGHGRQDITFPHQSEIKVNGGDVKANLRGLKNKPGSTRPVDITKELRLNIPAYSNSVEMTYALTNKARGESFQKYFLIVYVVKAIPVTDLVKRLENGKRITEKSVVDDMVNKARDADIVATATVLSLKCPLSTLRIELPCRSIACKHNQCFDATSYLQLQEQGPTWLCPICNNSAPFDTLAVDEYVRDILKNTPKSVDQVTVQPDGKWELHTRKENQPISKQNGFASDSDDSDIVEITKSGDSIRMSTHRASQTPVLGQLSRSSSIAARPSGSMSGSTSGKRPAAVIDLTSSGDEDEEPLARAPKRQQTNGFQPISVPAYRPGPPNGVPPSRI